MIKLGRKSHIHEDTDSAGAKQVCARGATWQRSAKPRAGEALADPGVVVLFFSRGLH